VLRSTGSPAITISPTSTVTELLAELARYDVGALVVVDQGTVVGIVSERDVVRRLNDRGGEILDGPVSDIMTAEVFTCPPDCSVDEVTRTMTERNIRHMPVVVGGDLAGVVSLREVGKNRIGELETESEWLYLYISSPDRSRCGEWVFRSSG
jgi:CBS domain-containing protein